MNQTFPVPNKGVAAVPTTDCLQDSVARLLCRLDNAVGVSGQLVRKVGGDPMLDRCTPPADPGVKGMPNSLQEQLGAAHMMLDILYMRLRALEETL